MSVAAGGDRAERDLRMPLLAVAAWVGALVALRAPVWVGAALAAGGLVLLARASLRGRGVLAVLTVAVVALGTGGVAGLHVAGVESGPVAALAADRSVVTVTVVVTSDPRPVRSRFGDRVVLRASVRTVAGRGRTWRVRAPVVLLAGLEWRGVELGQSLRVRGRLLPAEDDASGLLAVTGPPRLLASPGPWWQGADTVRRAVRESVEHRPADQRALIPALVVGDESRIDAELAEDFRATGLTHLLAVSGTNLTLLVGFLLVLARWVGVRGRWLHLVGALGIVGFVLLARTEPSVVRAATMGTVALVGLGRNGLRRGTRGLGVAVVSLLLIDPWLAVSVGFALSVLATAGILLLAPGWRDAMATWLPRWVAEAVSVPAAAQLACTPIVAVISGQVSLVAVAANLAAAPAVGPATVLGLSGGLVGLVSPSAGAVVGVPAGWCVSWIAAVARHGAALPTAAVDWAPGPMSIGLLCGLCVVLALVAPTLLRHPAPGLACASALVLVVVVGPPTPGWPPRTWVAAACDVGQGDALVLRAAPGQAVVVDAGPEEQAIGDCLRRLGVGGVPLLVLTHFHADHVDGLPGVLGDHRVGQVWVSPVPEPVAAAAAVGRELTRAHVPSMTPAAGTRVRVGEVLIDVLGPRSASGAGPGSDVGGEGSAANNASLVLLAQVRGVRLLLTGDIESPAQAALLRAHPDLRADVLKVPHHGSRDQDLDLLDSVHARLALVSVGADNSYGHPSPQTLRTLAGSGARILRTDTHGDLLVLVEDGRLAVRTGR